MVRLELKNIDLVIFDCDGVLVDSELLANGVLARHASIMGWEMNGEDALGIFKGMTMDQVHARIEQEIGLWPDKTWIAQYYIDCEAVFREQITAIPGAQACVTAVKASGRKVCVASQGPIAKMQVTLGETGLWELFDEQIYSATQVERPKPFPDLFLHAAHKLAVAPHRTCVIEDSLTGINAAHAAGMQSVYFTPSGAGSEEARALHACVVDDLSKIEML